MEKPQVGEDRAKPALTREIVLGAALALLDEMGVAGLSMRSLGKRLGVEAMSLYNHVANKDDLIDGALDLVIAEIAIPGPGALWRDAMRERAKSALAAFRRHPWASALIDSRLSSNAARLGYYDRILGNLHQAGFSLQQAASVFSVLDSYVYGFILQQSHLPAENVGGKNPAEVFYGNNPLEDYPYLAQLTKLAMGNAIDMDAEFDLGLNLILDGIAVLLAK